MLDALTPPAGGQSTGPDRRAQRGGGLDISLIVDAAADDCLERRLFFGDARVRDGGRVKIHFQIEIVLQR